MDRINGGNNSGDDRIPKKAVGYKSPPLHGRIKPGEVRNPHGRNGRRAEADDAFEKVRRRRGRVNFGGKTMSVMSDESYWLKVMSMALAGNMAAAGIIAKELAARRKLSPPQPTAEERAQEAAELEEREALAARLVHLLDDEASRKKASTPRFRPPGFEKDKDPDEV